MSVHKFIDTDPSIHSYWRSIILFGRNVTTYKLALGRALFAISKSENDLIKIEDLAIPYAQYLCTHLEEHDKQGVSKGSTFLDACRKFLRKQTNESQLIEQTCKYGFQFVLDKFHNVSGGRIKYDFFIDERKINKGIRLTDNLRIISGNDSLGILDDEAESRWRLVETAWGLGLSPHLISIDYDPINKQLTTEYRKKRKNITSCRGALSGYQKGVCFYCFAPIDIHQNTDVDVDHFLPFRLGKDGELPNIDGVWNLVLTCTECNRGKDGKFDRIPSLELLERLDRRNEYLIESNHPLRETLIAQTGSTDKERQHFLQECYYKAKESLIHTWSPDIKGEEIF